jgi:hypothetical protein
MAQWERTHSLAGVPERDLALARRNSSFQELLDRTVELDAQRIILENFQNNGTLLDANTAALIAAATAHDTHFRELFTNYTTEMNTTATNYHITLQQLVALQREPDSAVRARQFQMYQFDNLRANTHTVSEAANMSAFLANIHAQGFYDRDQYDMDVDPDSRSTWNPYDSQIYQAHLLGMTMQQYTDYLHQLGMGTQGSFNNLPEYTPNEIAAQRAQDLERFNAELLMSGNQNRLTYNSETGMWSPTDPNDTGVSLSSSNRRILHIDPFLPANFVSSTETFQNMIHGANFHNQAEADAYNLNLRAQIDAYSAEYERMAVPYNLYAQYHGGPYMILDREALYRERAATYTPLSSNVNDYVTVYGAGGTTTSVPLSATLGGNSNYIAAHRNGQTVYLTREYYQELESSGTLDTTLNNLMPPQTAGAGHGRNLTDGIPDGLNAADGKYYLNGRVFTGISPIDGRPYQDGRLVVPPVFERRPQDPAMIDYYDQHPPTSAEEQYWDDHPDRAPPGYIPSPDRNWATGGWNGLGTDPNTPGFTPPLQWTQEDEDYWDDHPDRAPPGYIPSSERDYSTGGWNGLGTNPNAPAQPGSSGTGTGTPAAGSGTNPGSGTGTEYGAGAYAGTSAGNTPPPVIQQSNDTTGGTGGRIGGGHSFYDDGF